MNHRGVRQEPPPFPPFRTFGQPAYEVKGAAFLPLASPWLKKSETVARERKRDSADGIRACPPEGTLVPGQEGAHEIGNLLLGTSLG